MEWILAVLLPILPYSLRCLNLQYTRFLGQVGILAIGNCQNSINPHRLLLFPASQRCDLAWIADRHEWVLSALTKNIKFYILKCWVFLTRLRACMHNLWPCDNGNSPTVHNRWDGQCNYAENHSRILSQGVAIKIDFQWVSWVQAM